VIHRELIQRERDRVLTQERKRELDLLLQFLSVYRARVVFPAFHEGKIIALILVQLPEFEDDTLVNMGHYAGVSGLMDDFSACIARLSRAQMEREKDRLILLGEMAAGLAHEVRNPLGAIRGAAELLDEGAGPWGKVIREETSRLNRLVSQFLDFAQDPKGVKERIDLNEAIEAALRNIRPGLSVGVPLEFERYSTPVWVRVGPDGLQQVLQNLIQNAIKAIDGKESGSIRVVVHENGFEVSDNGIGMDERTLSKVCQPFFTSFKNGTGLGLSICERLIHFDEGRLSISSEPGKGARFKVEYPNAG
jgi:signal transduction histidine kinase